VSLAIFQFCVPERWIQRSSAINPRPFALAVLISLASSGREFATSRPALSLQLVDLMSQLPPLFG
jgi:hypothetical protein